MRIKSFYFAVLGLSAWGRLALSAPPAELNSTTPFQVLISEQAEPGDFFGASISGYGDRILIGAWGDSDFGTATGAVYWFERSGGVWRETRKLLPRGQRDSGCQRSDGSKSPSTAKRACCVSQACDAASHPTHHLLSSLQLHLNYPQIRASRFDC